MHALEAMFREDFAGRILPFDSSAAANCTAAIAPRRDAGAPISQFDAQIATIALSHRMGLVTRNIADFEGCGLAVIDPWAGIWRALFGVPSNRSSDTTHGGASTGERRS